MARPLIFSNGELYVGLNGRGLVTDVFFPYVGSELHTRNIVHKIGVWVDGRISWVDDEDWSHRSRYPYNALVGHTVLTNEKLGVLVEFEDFVDSTSNVFIRNVHIVNLKTEEQEIKLFTHQAFNMSCADLDDTAQYLPDRAAVLHYNGKRAFVASGITDIGQLADQRSIGLFGDGLDGTWRDSEDGELTNGSVANGYTDSTLRFSLTVGGLSSRRVYYWLTAATSIGAAESLDSDMRKKGLFSRLEASTDSWQRWLSPGLKIVERLEPGYRQPFTQSLLHIKGHIDKRGAVVSASGPQGGFSAIPREGAFTIWPLMRLGYEKEAVNFFGFYKDRLSEDGYLVSSYIADGSRSASSHPYDGSMPPIQGDQTALVAFVFAQIWALSKQSRALKDCYYSLLVPMANFLSSFTDEDGLPKPSYDLSDDNKTVSTYTIAVTHAALASAADLAELSKDQDNAVKWRTSADQMYNAAISKIQLHDGIIRKSIDSSSTDIAAFFGSFMFGLFDIDSAALGRTLEYIEDTLKFEHGLFAFSDKSQGVDYVASLWMAQYYMEVGRRDDSTQILSRVIDDIKSGILKSESSVWVHAELVSTLLDTMTVKS